MPESSNIIILIFCASLMTPYVEPYWWLMGMLGARRLANNYTGNVAHNPIPLNSLDKTFGTGITSSLRSQNYRSYGSIPSSSNSQSAQRRHLSDPLRFTTAPPVVWSTNLHSLDKSEGGSPEAVSTNRYQTDAEAISAWCKLPGLSKGQQKLCVLYYDHMYGVGKGAQYGIHECQYQFRTEKWNCSVRTNDETVFGPILNIPSRETAFTHAINSAGVVYAISRFCRQGVLSSCGCAKTKRPGNLQSDWTWAGCGDNLKYGYYFAKEFIDIREREEYHKHLLKNPNKHNHNHNDIKGGKNVFPDLNNNNGQSAYPQRGSRSLNNSDIMGRESSLKWLLRNNQLLAASKRRDFTSQRQLNKYAKSLMNLHNNEAGRRAVYHTSQVRCKCHGLSDSCNVKTCWLQLGPFRHIGQLLKDKYQGATKVKLNGASHLEVVAKTSQTLNINNNDNNNVDNNRPISRRNSAAYEQFKDYPKSWKVLAPTALDLVFLKQSPDFCRKNTRLGFTTGTRDRLCGISHVSQETYPTTFLADTVFDGSNYRSNNMDDRRISKKSISFNEPIHITNDISSPYDNNFNSIDNHLGTNDIHENNQEFLFPGELSQQLDSINFVGEGSNNNIYNDKDNNANSNLLISYLAAHHSHLNETTSRCRELCCSKQYYTRQVTVRQRCHCKFKWCCEVKCQTCIKNITLMYCK